jgi:hypothetical protein
MIFQRPRDKEEDLAIQGYEGWLKVISFFIKAEGRIPSAFYLFPLTPSLSPGVCVVIEWRCVKTGQPAGFQSFRMRTFKVMGYYSRHRNLNFSRALNPQNLIAKRLRSKAFSPVCLFRFSEL